MKRNPLDLAVILFLVTGSVLLSGMFVWWLVLTLIAGGVK